MIFKEIALSVRSFEFYEKVLDKSWFKMIRYFFTLIFLYCLFLAGFAAGPILDNYSTQIFSKLPANAQLQITQGQVSSNLEEPFMQSFGNFSLVVDTSGETQTLSAQIPRGLLVMNDRLLYKQDYLNQHIIPLSNVKDMTLSQEAYEQSKGSLKMIAIPFLALTYFSLQLMFEGIMVVLFAWLARIINMQHKAPFLPFKQAFAVAVHALTPALLFAVVINLIPGIPPSLQILGQFIIYFLYINGALKHLNKKNLRPS